MDSTHLAPMDGAKKQRAMQDARDMAGFIARSAERANCAVPPYDFIELIGKGGSGRVYKCRSRATGDLVAIKIINTDEIDYAQHAFDKDDTIRDFKKEVSILNQLKDSNAKNVNMIHDAFAFQEQLWIICDYCTGGSVRTLLRARTNVNTGLEENFVITIARELAWAMKSVHDIGIIHRDIKCTNVYVNERGDIQLGDFGIVGITDEESSKRRTIIGTPHYMPPELHLPSDGNQAPNAYGKEIDVWSYGCSVYEMATGQPPNSHITNINILNQHVLQDAPRLEGDNYSPELCAFVAFCLTMNPSERPTADDILRHPFIANTQKRYPTSTLVRLIERYKMWEVGGGQRASLWMPGGAPDVPTLLQEPEHENDDDDDWNFSTSDDFDEAFGKRYSQMVETHDHAYPSFETPTEWGLPPIQTQDLTPFQQHMQRREERSATRGAASLQRLWTTDSDSAPYELHTPVDVPLGDDLPLRSAQAAPPRESMIDLDEGYAMGSEVPSLFDFGSDMPTLKAKRARLSTHGHQDDDQDYQYVQSDDDLKRATMEWTFPNRNRATMEWTFPKSDPVEPEANADKIGLPTPGEDGKLAPGFRPMLKHTTTVPLGQFGDYMHTTEPASAQLPTPDRSSVLSMVDLDASLADPTELPRPSTATSMTGSTMTDMTSGNPFDLEDERQETDEDKNRHSYHKPWQSEGGQLKQRNSRKSIPMHTRGNSLSSTDSELDRVSRSESDIFDRDYKVRLRNSIRRPMHSQQASDTTDTESDWPSFTSSFTSISQTGDRNYRQDSRRPSDITSAPRSLQMNGLSQASMFRVRQPEVDFPSLAAPHPDVLTDEAEGPAVVAELTRLLDEFTDGLSITMDVLKHYTGWDDQDEIPESDENFVGDESGLDGGDELR